MITRSEIFHCQTAISYIHHYIYPNWFVFSPINAIVFWNISKTLCDDTRNDADQIYLVHVAQSVEEIHVLTRNQNKYCVSKSSREDNLKNLTSRTNHIVKQSDIRSRLSLVYRRRDKFYITKINNSVLTGGHFPHPKTLPCRKSFGENCRL